jgi:predicted ATPase/transcriptional regulator with XRE-family HTH domain
MLQGVGGTAGGTTERFGALLRMMRERAGMTQEELADRAGLTPYAISALERGTRKRPYPNTVRSIADALDASADERLVLIASIPARGDRRTDATESTARSQTAPGMAVARARLLIPPTRLYGREADVAAVAEVVRSGAARLVSLTGPGGVGKTRLAAAVSDELSPEYPDGVVQVALAAVVDATDVFATVGRALGLVGSDGPDAFDVIADHLQDLRLLLVLDNFEHLLSAAAQVGRLIALRPRVTVLVSSRSPLRVRGEREYAVDPLVLPSLDVTSADALAASPAGALVLDRARAVAPRLATGASEIRALGELCHRLAGLPLAIELAGAHLRLLSPQSLLERLDDVTSTSGARDLPERQRTMRATLDWSFGLLTPQQQTLFRLLGIFRAGASLEAIESVADRSGALPAREVLDLLVQLVEQSLVVVRVGVDGQHRYDFLEPVAQYARSLLVAEEATRASLAHAQVYLALAERAAVGYENADQVDWLARTEADEANLLVAVDRSLDVGDGATAGRIAWAMWLYWWLRGQVTVGRRYAELCLAADLPRAVRSRVLLTAATMSYAAGDAAPSAEHWASAFQLGQEDSDPEVGTKGRAGTGLAALTDGDLGLATQCFREALTLGHQAGDAGIWMRSLVHVWLGTLLLLQSDPTGAVLEIKRGLELARGRGDRLSTYVALYNLSQAAIAVGDYMRAREHLEEGIELSGQTQDRANLAYFLETLAAVEAADGEARRVAGLLGAATSLREKVGADVYAYYLPDESLRTAAEDGARRALGDDAYDEAMQAGRALELPDTVDFALNGDVGFNA